MLRLASTLALLASLSAPRLALADVILPPQRPTWGPPFGEREASPPAPAAPERPSAGCAAAASAALAALGAGLLASRGGRRARAA